MRAKGDTEQAEHFYLEALRTAPADVYAQSIINFNLGSNAIERGDVDAAEHRFHEAIQAHKSPQSLFRLVAAGIGYAHVMRGDFRVGGLLIGYMQGALLTVDTVLDPSDRLLFEKMIALGQEQGGALFESSFNEGQSLSFEDVKQLIDPQLPKDK